MQAHQMASTPFPAAATAGVSAVPNPPALAASTATFTARVARHPAELARHVEAWEALAARALAPNPFYEHWMLLPSLRMLDREDCELEVVMVHRSERPGGPDELVGLFPLVRRPRFRGLPVPYLSALHHRYCPDTTPLVDRRHARPCFTAFLDWLEARRDTLLLEVPRLVADGPVHHALTDALDPRRFLCFPDEDSTRALLLRRGPGADAYLTAALGGHGRKRLRAKERHLRDLGRLEAVTLGDGAGPGPGADLDAFMDEFLALESRGWKGREGTDIAARDADVQFFRDVVSAAFRRRRLLAQSLRLDGRAVAMKISFLGEPGAFAWKIAFDEDYSRDSPGVLLEVEAIRELFARPELEWIDSCAASDSRMFRELYLDRRELNTLLVARLDGIGGLLIALVPLRRWARGTLHRGLRLLPTLRRGEA